MKIYIDKSAFVSDSEKYLPQTSLFAIKYLQFHGYELAFDRSVLSPDQQKLLELELILNHSFEAGDAEAIIKKEKTFRLISGEYVIAEASLWENLAKNILFPERKSSITRNTKETQISAAINLDGTGESNIKTGLNFFDHMLDQIARHGLVDITLQCDGDLQVDEHHTIEDTAIVLGLAIRDALGDSKAGIQRYGFVLAMDESQASVTIDLSDRPYLRWDVPLHREYVGDFPTEMLEHFFYTLAMNAKATLHVTANGKNEHHMIEAVFKGFAKALRFSISRNERNMGILPTTKGTI
jgi:imidazoleglycerol-phosphate dehydratase / histidinol-phosphatase